MKPHDPSHEKFKSVDGRSYGSSPLQTRIFPLRLCTPPPPCVSKTRTFKCGWLLWWIFNIADRGSSYLKNPPPSPPLIPTPHTLSELVAVKPLMANRSAHSRATPLNSEPFPLPPTWKLKRRASSIAPQGDLANKPLPSLTNPTPGEQLLFRQF